MRPARRARSDATASDRKKQKGSGNDAVAAVAVVDDHTMYVVRNARNARINHQWDPI